MPLASYLLVVLRPWYAELLLRELVKKTTASYEVLVWMNCEAPGFEALVLYLASRGCSIRIVGRSPENVGMVAFRNLIEAASGDLLVQFDDDVIMVSRRAIELCREVFSRRPDVGLLVGGVWQDEYTSGGHGKPSDYLLVDRENLLYDGPVDGGFTFYRKEAVKVLLSASFRKYWGMGAETIHNLKGKGLSGYLFGRVKMLHLHGPVYHQYFGKLDFEVEKFKSVGFRGMASVYERCLEFPPRELVEKKLLEAEEYFDKFDGASEVA